MSTPQRTRNEPSVHQSALDNLRRGGRRTAIFLGAVFGALALFTGVSMLLASQSIPTPPASAGKSSAGSAGEGEDPGSARDGGRAADDEVAAWRKQLVAFLNSADDPGTYDPGRWFPGGAAPKDRLVYTPLTPDDPGTHRKDGTAEVGHTGMTDPEVGAVLDAVSRDGTVLPTSLAPVTTSGTNEGWTMFFSVTTEDGKHLKGQADGYSHPQNGTVIERFTYEK